MRTFDEEEAVSGLQFVAFSADGRNIILQDESGNWVEVPITAQTASAAPAQLDPNDGSELSPRDIQSKIRAGATPEDLSKTYNHPLERIMMFAPPILMERKFVANKASGTIVRRANGSAQLHEVVVARLEPLGVSADSLAWDSFKREDGRWTVLLTYPTAEGPRVAAWLFDARNAALVPADDEARWLTGEPLPKPAQPVVEPSNPTVVVPRLSVVRDTPVSATAPPAPPVPATAATSQKTERLDFPDGGLFSEAVQPDVEVDLDPDPVDDFDQSVGDDFVEHESAGEAEVESPARKLPSWDDILFGGGNEEN